MSQVSFDSHVLNNAMKSIFVCLFILIISGIGAKNLYFRGDYKVFFDETNEQRLAYENMQKTFTKNESASILITSNKGSLFTQEALTLIKQITDASWQVPLSTRVDSISNFQRSYSAGEANDELVVEELILEVDWLTPQYIETVKEVSLSEPELIDKLIAAHGKTAMVNITVQLPDGDQTKEINEIGAYLRAMIAPIAEANPDFDIRLSGLVIMTDSFFLAAQTDASSLFPIMLSVFTLLLIVLMRSLKAALLTMLIVIVSIAATMGLGGWAGMFINVATVNVPVIIMTLAIADSVHLIAGVKFYMESGSPQQKAIMQSLALNKKAIIITSVTTAIGFLTLNFAQVPVLADMGNMVAMGVVFACLFSLVLLPALLTKVTLNYARIESNDSTNIWYRLTNKVAIHSRLILIAAFLLSGVSGYLVLQNKLNDIPIEYFNEGNEFRTNADFQQDNLTGLTTVDFALYTDKENGVLAPEFLQTLSALTDWLRAQPEVDHVVSFSDTLKRLNMNMNADDPAFYTLPLQQDIAAQYVLLYEMSLPYGFDINNQIDIKKSAIRLLVTTQNLGSNELTAFEQRTFEWLQTNSPQYRMTAASIPLIFAHIGKANMMGIVQGAALALVLISFILLFALKSLKLGLVSIIPNIMPAIFGFAIWALISGNISMALAVVITMPLGIIVDDTVHFLVKYKAAKELGKNNHESVLFAYKNVSKALITTTVVLVSGFAVLGFSDFAINSEMGILTAVIIALALLIDLLVLPAVLLIRKN